MSGDGDKIEVRHLRDVARLLLETPGDWYLLAHGPVDKRHGIASKAYRIRRHQMSCFQEELAASGLNGQWETTVRTVRGEEDPDEVVRCYVRFVPDPG